MVAMKKSSLCMTEVLEEYDRLREGHVSGSEFWDVVILTTSDAAQQNVYELEIANKLKQNELPTSARYHVVHDPPGAKIGSGGSTMYTLSKLTELEPEWRDQKILLMHAGGSSQRLPNASVLGKAFTTIPIGSRIYTMFDVKLALCMPFAQRIPPGVFICCPDTFEIFTFGNGDDWDFGNRKGFLALAHPSPMHIGTGHGVYVLTERNNKLDTEVLTCTKVLQKPTECLMRKEGAVIRTSEVPENIRSGSDSDEEWVYTDSAYFFDHSISDKFLSYYEKHKPLSGEICAYGDFLQPLGSDADDAYISNCKNIMRMSDGLLATRQQVFNLLKNSPLSVIALKQSKFYHIGTLAEYIDNFCSNTDLRMEMGLSKFCYSAYDSPSSGFNRQSSMGGCIIHSLINDNCRSSSLSVVEYCKFTAKAGVVVEQNCVISNCEYFADDSGSAVVIPENTFMQTVPVLDPNGIPKYVTLLFSVNDDMKSSASSIQDVSNISYFNRSILSVAAGNADRLFAKGNPLSLWEAKLFPLVDTAQSSFLLALYQLKTLLSPTKRRLEGMEAEQLASNDCCCSTTNCINNPVSQRPRSGSNLSSNGIKASQITYSFADVIKYKDATRMIKERNELSNLIKDALAAGRG